jgi:hypothetical protein
MTIREPSDGDFLGAVPASRRDFLKKMATVAFAVPVIGAFTMDSVAHAGTKKRRRRVRQTYGNMTHGNQSFCNQNFPDSATTA